MKVADYNDFVRRTDQSKGKPPMERRSIALYGLVGEIGSLLSAVKKKLLGEAGVEEWDQPNEEIIEELGDVTWYCFALSHVENDPRPVNIFTADIALLKREIGRKNARAKKIHAALDPAKKEAFLVAADDFPSTKDMTFEHYQKLAFLTSRTKGRDLLEVCLAVIWQLGAELLRKTLPDIELTLNKNVADRDVNVVLGELGWHLAAITSLFGLSMNAVAQKNVEKVSFRADRDAPTPLHDADRKAFEQFPRVFDVAFISIGRGRSRMYFQGKQLGNELTDNAYDDDGYRFHDVFHLANVAHLGWSPVMRGLMGRKRKSRDDRVDEVEDGARAQIVDELVQKAIHSEGVRLVKETNQILTGATIRTFPRRSAITFRFLKGLRIYVENLECWKNKYWEWEDAIYEGAEAYFHLRTEQQGTVTVDLNERKLTYSPDVCLDLKGVAVGFGTGAAAASISQSEIDMVLTKIEQSLCKDQDCIRAVSAKRAILNALTFSSAPPWLSLEIKLLEGDRVCVRARDAVAERMWSTGTVSFRLTFAESRTETTCTATALADPKALVA